MADTLTPEQRAYDICEALHLRHGWVQREIADAIRAAETAAVQAERARCAQFARQSDKGQDLTGDELADLILATEADNAR